MGDGQRAAEHVGQLLGGLSAAHVGGDDDEVVGIEAHGVVVVGEERQGGEVVHRDVEEALDLALVQVERDDAVHAGALEQVGDEAGGDGLTRASLAVLTGVAVVGDDGGDGAGGSALGGIRGDEELHEHVVDVLAGNGLDQEDVGAADGLVIASVDLAVGELLERKAGELHAELIGDLLGERTVGGTGVHSQDLAHIHGLFGIGCRHDFSFIRHNFLTRSIY